MTDEASPAGSGPGRPPRSLAQRLLQEPLLHFLLAGGALFLLASGSAEDEGLRAAFHDDKRITVSVAEVERLVATFQSTQGRLPSQVELEGLIEEEIKDEVYVRQARAMGLDQGDLVIRRRLRQKVEYLAEDVANFVAPSEEQLAQYLAQHPEEFRQQGRTTFESVYLSGERGSAVEADARDLLAKLQADPDQSLDPLGDRSLAPPDMRDASFLDVSNVYGPNFAQGLERLPEGEWAGPLTSHLGLHLVRVRERVPGALLPLAEVRDAVEREWRERRRQQHADAFYRKLRAEYTIEVEQPDAGQSNESKAEQEAGPE